MSHTRETCYRIAGNPSIENNEPYGIVNEKEIRSHNYFPTVGENAQYSDNRRMPVRSTKPMGTQIRIRATAPIGDSPNEEDKRKKKKKKSFIEKWIQKAECVYKNYGGKQEKLLCNGNDSMMYPNEYINNHPTDRVKYRKRTPNETSVQSDFNKINIKPFIRYNKKGQESMNQKARIVLSSKGVPSYPENPMAPINFSGSPLNRCNTVPATRPVNQWSADLNSPPSSSYPNFSAVDGRRPNGLEKDGGRNKQPWNMNSPVPTAEVGPLLMGTRKNVSFQNSKFEPKRNMQYKKPVSNKSVVDKQGNVVLRIVTNDNNYEPEVFRDGNEYRRKASYDKNAPMNSSVYSFSRKNEIQRQNEIRGNKTAHLLGGTKSMSSSSYVYPLNNSYENENVTVLYEPSNVSTSRGNTYSSSYNKPVSSGQYITEYKNKSSVPSIHLYTKDNGNCLDNSNELPYGVNSIECTKIMDAQGNIRYIPVTTYCYEEKKELQENHGCPTCCSHSQSKLHCDQTCVVERPTGTSKRTCDWNHQKSVNGETVQHECTCNIKVKPSTSQNLASCKEVSNEEWVEKGNKQTSDGTEMKYNETISDFNTTDNSKNKYSSIAEVSKRNSKNSIPKEEEGSITKSSRQKLTESILPNAYGLSEIETLKEENDFAEKVQSTRQQRASSVEKVDNLSKRSVNKEKSERTNSKVYESPRTNHEQGKELIYEFTCSRRHNTSLFVQPSRRSNNEISMSKSNNIERNTNTERNNKTERSNKIERSNKTERRNQMERSHSNNESGICKMIKDKSNYDNTIEQLSNDIVNKNSKFQSGSRIHETKRGPSDSLRSYQNSVKTNHSSDQNKEEGTSRSRNQSALTLMEPTGRIFSERRDTHTNYLTAENEEAIVPYSSRGSAIKTSRTKEQFDQSRDRSLLQLKDYETISDRDHEFGSFSNLPLIKRESIPKTIQIQNSIKGIKDWERETNEDRKTKYLIEEKLSRNGEFTNKSGSRYTYANGDRGELQNENTFSHLKTLIIRDSKEPVYERDVERTWTNRNKDSTSEFGMGNRKFSQMNNSRKSTVYREDANISGDIKNKSFSDLHPDSYNNSLHTLDNMLDYELKPKESVQFHKLSSHDYMQSVNESKSRNTMGAARRTYQYASSDEDNEYSPKYKSEETNNGGYMGSFEDRKSSRNTRNQSMYSRKSLTKETRSSPISYKMFTNGSRSRVTQSRSYPEMMISNKRSSNPNYSKSMSQRSRSKESSGSRSQKSMMDIERNNSRRPYETMEDEEARTLDTCSFRGGGGISEKVFSGSNTMKYRGNVTSGYNISNNEISNRNMSGRMSKGVSRGTTRLSNRFVDKCGTYSGRNDVNSSNESFGERKSMSTHTFRKKSNLSQMYPSGTFGRSRIKTDRSSMNQSASMQASRRQQTKETEPFTYSKGESIRNDERSKRSNGNGTNRKLKNTYEIYEENSIYEPDTDVILDRQIPEDLFYHGASDGEIRNTNSQMRTSRTGESMSRSKNNGMSYRSDNTFGQRSKSTKVSRSPSAYSRKSRTNTEAFKNHYSNSVNKSKTNESTNRQEESRGYSFRNNEQPVESYFYSGRINNDQVKSAKYSTRESIRKIRSDIPMSVPMYDEGSTVHENIEPDRYPKEDSYSQRNKSTYSSGKSLRKTVSEIQPSTMKSATGNPLVRGNTYHTCNKDIILQKKPTLHDSMEDMSRIISNKSRSRSRSQSKSKMSILPDPSAYGIEETSRNTRKSKSKLGISKVPLESTAYSRRNEVESSQDLQESNYNRYTSKRDIPRSGMYSSISKPLSVRKCKSAIGERNTMRQSKSLRKGNTSIPYETLDESIQNPYISSSNVKGVLSDTANFAFSPKEESMSRRTHMGTSTISHVPQNRSNISMRSKSRNNQKSWQEFEMNKQNTSKEKLSSELYDTEEREMLATEEPQTSGISKHTDMGNTEIAQTVQGTASFKKNYSGIMLNEDKSNLTKFQLTDTSQETEEVTSHIDTLAQQPLSQKKRTSYIPNSSSVRNQESKNKITRRSSNKSIPLVSNPFSKKNMSEQCRKNISSSIDATSSENSFNTISSKDRDFDLYYVERLPFKKKFNALLPKVLGGRKHKKDVARRKERSEQEKEEEVVAMEKEMIPQGTTIYPISMKTSMGMTQNPSKLPSFTNAAYGDIYDNASNRTMTQNTYKSRNRTRRGTPRTIDYSQDISSKVIPTEMGESVRMAESGQTRNGLTNADYEPSYRPKEKRVQGSDDANSLCFFESTEERIPRELLMSERKMKANNSCNTSYTSDGGRSMNTGVDPITTSSSRYQKNHSNVLTGEMQNRSNRSNIVSGKSSDKNTAKFATDPSEQFNDISTIRNSRSNGRMTTNPRMNTLAPIYENGGNSRYGISQKSYEGNANESVRTSRESPIYKSAEEYATSYGDLTKYDSVLESKPSVLSQGMNCVNNQRSMYEMYSDENMNNQSNHDMNPDHLQSFNKSNADSLGMNTSRRYDQHGNSYEKQLSNISNEKSLSVNPSTRYRRDSSYPIQRESSNHNEYSQGHKFSPMSETIAEDSHESSGKSREYHPTSHRNTMDQNERNSIRTHQSARASQMMQSPNQNNSFNRSRSSIQKSMRSGQGTSVIGIDNANEFMKDQLNYILDHTDDEIEKNSRIMSTQIDRSNTITNPNNTISSQRNNSFNTERSFEEPPRSYAPSTSMIMNNNNNTNNYEPSKRTSFPVQNQHSYNGTSSIPRISYENGPSSMNQSQLNSKIMYEPSMYTNKPSYHSHEFSNELNQKSMNWKADENVFQRDRLLMQGNTTPEYMSPSPNTSEYKYSPIDGNNTIHNLGSIGTITREKGGLLTRSMMNLPSNGLSQQSMYCNPNYSVHSSMQPSSLPQIPILTHAHTSNTNIPTYNPNDQVTVISQNSQECFPNKDGSEISYRGKSMKGSSLHLNSGGNIIKLNEPVEKNYSTLIRQLDLKEIKKDATHRTGNARSYEIVPKSSYLSALPQEIRVNTMQSNSIPKYSGHNSRMNTHMSNFSLMNNSNIFQNSTGTLNPRETKSSSSLMTPNLIHPNGNMSHVNSNGISNIANSGSGITISNNVSKIDNTINASASTIGISNNVSRMGSVNGSTNQAYNGEGFTNRQNVNSFSYVNPSSNISIPFEKNASGATLMPPYSQVVSNVSNGTNLLRNQTNQMSYSHENINTQKGEKSAIVSPYITNRSNNTSYAMGPTHNNSNVISTELKNNMSFNTEPASVTINKSHMSTPNLNLNMNSRSNSYRY